ncbi:hypothetical Protein YC6258_05788 [Gynuella sunshinyii YC6258]|uniref:Uncharacterized protein n=1 Tax=Gynuella sunshinyii YC6258 TaxID=1445510 RepID=A0A0C5VUJ1_9GAMM|nr:hypothetical Protein YC6258_05788 [Gynuella sunshinyii YC6258]
MYRHTSLVTFIISGSPLVDKVWRHIGNVFHHEVYDSMSDFLMRGTKKLQH